MSHQLEQRRGIIDVHPVPGIWQLVIVNARLWRERPGSPRFLMRCPEGVRSCWLTGAGFEMGSVLSNHEALGARPRR